MWFVVSPTPICFVCATLLCSAYLVCAKSPEGHAAASESRVHGMKHNGTYINCTEIAELQARANRTKNRYYLEPLLHDCLRRHAVDPSQLPAIVLLFLCGRRVKQSFQDTLALIKLSSQPGASFTPVPLEFDFNYNSLVQLQNDGTFLMKAYIKLEWIDPQRMWNETAYGIESLYLPANEVLFTRWGRRAGRTMFKSSSDRFVLPISPARGPSSAIAPCRTFELLIKAHIDSQQP